MATVSNARPQSKPWSKGARHFRLAVEVENKLYLITRVPCDPECGSGAWRWHNPSEDTTYFVRETDFGFECECQGCLHSGRCKHAAITAALREQFAAKGGAA